MIIKWGMDLPRQDIFMIGNNYGLDYIEGRVGDWIDELNLHNSIGDNVTLPFHVLNRIFPLNINCFETPVDILNLHIQRVFELAQSMQVQKIIFGSGHARNIPAHISKPRAQSYFMELLGTWADMLQMQNANIQLLLEPLSPEETNYINSLEEGVVLVEKLNKSNIGLVADTYHCQMKEIENLASYRPWVRHVHLAEPGSRKAPGISLLSNIIHILEQEERIHTVSFECRWQNMPEELARITTFIALLSAN